MRVFWPALGIGRVRGVAVGWTVRGAICVVSVVDDAANVDASQLAVLGAVRSAQQDASGGTLTGAGEGEAGLVFWVDGKRVVGCSRPVQIVYFRPPDRDRLQFFTLRQRASIPTDGAGADDMEAILARLNETRGAQRALGQPSSPGTVFALSTPAASAIGALLAPVQAALSLLATAATGEMTALAALVARRSALIAQLTLRARQAADAPAAFAATREPGVDVATRSARYMAFWNTAWLVLNDVILGSAACALVLDAAPALAAAIPALFEAHLIRNVVAATRWLDDWPVGLKLNTPLSRFSAAALGGAVDAWSAVILPLFHAHLALALRLAAATSALGLTFTLGLAADALALLTLHVRAAAWVLTQLARWQLDSLGALWNLFRGKRWNVLRHRTDSYDYDVDQLFLGTLLFTTSAFLFPTVAAYAALFALIQYAICTAQRALGYAVTALNAFPLCELLLRIKEPSRLPAGIVFVPFEAPDTSPSSGVPIVAAWELRNAPESFADIFKRV
ncbi:pig-Q [Cryptotrichosporon argae]